MAARTVYCVVPHGTPAGVRARAQAELPGGIEVIEERRLRERRRARTVPRSREEDRRTGADRRRPTVPRDMPLPWYLPEGSCFVQRLVQVEASSELLELEDVVARVRRLDAAAATELYWRTYDRLHSRLLVLLADDELADALVRVAFGRVLDFIEDGEHAEDGFDELLYLAVDDVARAHVPALPEPPAAGEDDEEDHRPTLALEGVEERVTVVDRDSRWYSRALAERHRLLRACREDFVAVEHVGSTAVPAIAGRPVVDLIVGVRALPPGERLRAALLDGGYEELGDAGTPGRGYYRRRGPQRDVDVHVVEHGGRLWRDAIAFREFLRRNPGEARRWGNVKKEAARGGTVPFDLYCEARRQGLAELLERLEAATMVVSP